MISVRQSALGLALLVFLGKPAVAAQSQVLGEGLSSCQDFVTQFEMQPIRLEWVLGYISGRNSEAMMPLAKMTGRSIHDAETPLNWLTNYCKANPPHPLIVAADKFRAELEKHEE